MNGPLGGAAMLVLSLFTLGLATALVRARRELARQEQARKELLADVAHELKTPLSGLLLQLELLASNPLSEEQKRKVLVARNEGRALDQRMRDLLVLARDDLDKLVLSPHPTNLQRLLGDLCNTLRETLEPRSVQLETDFVPEILRVLVDPHRCDQIVRNLVGNAAEAMGTNGGKVVVRVRPADGFQVAIEVEDDGPGIPPQEQATLFERFQRGEGRRGAGTGLGLAIVKRLAERHGGSVSLRSTVGLGSTFRVLLPAADPRALSQPGSA